MTNVLTPLPERIVPSEDVATALFEAQGGKLTREWRVGTDPLSRSIRKQVLRETKFNSLFSFESIFSSVVSGDRRPFIRGLTYFINLTFSLSSQP